MTFLRRLLAGIAPAALAACSAHPGLPPASASLPSILQPSANDGEDWLTFANGYDRTGFQAAGVGLSPATVKHVKLRWKRSLGTPVYASPLAYQGNVIVVTLGESGPPAVVTALRESDGATVWQRTLGGGVRATPSIDPGTGELFVSDRNNVAGPSTVYAIRLLDGSIAWQHAIPGLTHASPVVAGGRVYFGISGGDPTACVNGGIAAFNERTGAPEWRWELNPAPLGGGSVWGAIAFDGQHLIFGTGNTCTASIPDANGAVALNLDGTVDWFFTAVKYAQSDDDTGSGVALFNGTAAFTSKNGSIYDVGEGTGGLSWSAPMGAADEWGGFATPSTDGTTVVDGAGLFPVSKRTATRSDGIPKRGAPNDVWSGYTSKLVAFDSNGAVRWTRTMTNRITGDVTLVDGMGLVGLDKAIVALDLQTGKTLWSYSAPNYFDAPVIVVRSGVYAADDGGNVYAFSIP